MSVSSPPLAGGTADAGGGGAEAVSRLELRPGAPNPFGAGSVIHYALPRSATVFLEVLDVSGRRVRILMDTPRPAGRHRVTWDGRDGQQRRVASGVYLYRLDAAGGSITKKVVVLR